MNTISRALSRCVIPAYQTVWRSQISPVAVSLVNKDIAETPALACRMQGNLLMPSIQNVTTTRSYKVKNVLKLRCPDCMYVKRHGRLFVECKTNPRHKQMSLIGKHKLFKDDYTEGKYWEQVYSKYREERYYRIANEKFVKYDWLGDRLGRDV